MASLHLLPKTQSSAAVADDEISAYNITLVVKRNSPKKYRPSSAQEYDGVFLLKLTLYLLLGSMWLKLSHGNTVSLPIPLGLIIGIIFAQHEHFQIDRKIEYAMLLIAMLIGFFAPFGLYVSF